MSADDPDSPHLHIVGPDFQVLMRIAGFEVLAGEAGASQLAEAREWAEAPRDELALKWIELNERGMTMPKKVLPRIESVAVATAPLTLLVRWRHGGESLIDLAGVIGTFRVFAPLRANPALFAMVRVGDQGTDIVWNDDIDMANDTLWRLAQEQSGATMTAEAFQDWRKRHALTLDAAARSLGLSRRMVAYYDQGTKPIPRVVALATRALETM